MSTELATMYESMREDASAVSTATGSGGDFFPRVELTTGLNKIVQDGRAGIGIYAINDSANGVVVPLGKVFPCFVAAARAKAICFADDVVVSYDAKSDVFARIAAESEAGDKNYRYGPEFLLWIPLPEGGVFATFHCNNKSFRRLGQAFAERIGAPMMLGVKAAKNSKGEWKVPAIEPYDDNIELLNLPEDMVSAVKAYMSLPSTDAAAN
jgi:hypothetical protein